jgi:transposase
MRFRQLRKSIGYSQVNVASTPDLQTLGKDAPMLHLTFTEDDLAALQFERYHHPHPRVQRRMEALWLKSQNLSHDAIARITGISPNTLRSYFRDFQQGGVEALKRLDFYRPQSELDQHKTTLENYFLEHPPVSIKEAMAAIEEQTGIKRCPTQVGAFLKRLGLKRRMVGVLPAKADPEAQADFKKSDGTPTGRGHSGQAGGILRGRLSFRFRSFPGVSVVLVPLFCPHAIGTEALQRAGSAECSHETDHQRQQ